jgi:hypothetical protein
MVSAFKWEMFRTLAFKKELIDKITDLTDKLKELDKVYIETKGKFLYTAKKETVGFGQWED